MIKEGAAVIDVGELCNNIIEVWKLHVLKLVN